VSPSATLEQIAPQKGPQAQFAACDCDIAVYGGSAGGGKSFALLLEPLHYVDIPNFSAIVFRRTYPQIKQLGGLFDVANELYRPLGAKVNETGLSFEFPSGARVRFSHLQYEADKFSWQGSALPLILWDELTHFSESQFWYLLSRNRSLCGVRPYVRATCNPEPGSWVEKLIEWWIGADGYPIKERSGAVRWFVRQGNKILWADSKEELPQKDETGQPNMPRSFTFISAKLEDNPALNIGDPAYRANLMALPLYEREILLGGNWRVRPEGGMRFKRLWFEIVADYPRDGGRMVRYWDRASTIPSDANPDPDHTAGARVYRSRTGLLYIVDMRRDRMRPLGVQAMLQNTASQDGDTTELWLEEDPAQAGQVEKQHLSTALAEYAPHWVKPTGSKWTRSGPLSAAAEVGNVKLVRGAWNEAFLDEAEAFVDEDQVDTPTGYHDDQIDAADGAAGVLLQTATPRIT
jgi:predicted phage terminase large subunit-like protein